MRALAFTSLAALVATGLLSFPADTSAQSLAEIAAKQKEKRKGKSTRVFTEEDLRKGPARGFTSGDPSEPAGAGEPQAATGSAAPTAEGAQAPQKSEDELRAERQAAWRDKLQKARDNVTQLTAEVGRLEAALNDLTVPVYGATRTTRVEAHQKAKQQLAGAQQAVLDTEEEGRRNGFR